MKNKQTETEIEIYLWSRTSFNKRGTVFSGYQSNLRARVGAESVCVDGCQANGNIYEFTPNGVRSTFASGLNSHWSGL